MTRIVAWAAVFWMAACIVGAFADNFKPSYPVHIIPTVPKGEVVSTDVREVCAGKGAYKNVHHAGGTYSQNHRLSQTKAIKHHVMEQSGVPWADRKHYEDDHYCPLSLGCSDSIDNRWAQPRFGTWNAAKKDKLETIAGDLVCAGKLDLATAQGWFQTKITPDWRAPYCKQISDDPDCAQLHATR